MAELIVLSMLGALLFCGKILLEFIGNVEIVSALIMVYTLVYRVRALIPIYVYVFLLGIYYGFAPMWWPFHLYIWLVLWGITLLLPRLKSEILQTIIYIAVAALFGLAYGALTAPVAASAFGYTVSQWPLYIAAGLYFDLIHAAGNAAFGILVLPLAKALGRLRIQMLKKQGAHRSKM